MPNLLAMPEPLNPHSCEHRAVLWGQYFASLEPGMHRQSTRECSAEEKGIAASVFEADVERC